MIDKVVLLSIPIEELKEIIGQVVEEKLREFSSNLSHKKPPEKEFLMRQEVCQMLHVKSVTTLWRYAREGRLKQHRVGRKHLMTCFSLLWHPPLRKNSNNRNESIDITSDLIN